MRDMAKTAGPIGGVIAILVLALSFFSRGSPEAAEKLDKYFAGVDAQSPAERHRDVETQVSELEAITADPGYPRLPNDKRAAVTERLVELRAYASYEAALDKIDSPASAANDAKLAEIQEQLRQVKVPVAYQVEWSQTDAGVRHRRLQEDVQALERSIADVTRGYRQLCDDAAQLKKDIEGPNLPGRARKILAEAKKLPTPDADAQKPIPGSDTVTYATVFGFDRVRTVYHEWEQARDRVINPAAMGG